MKKFILWFLADCIIASVIMGGVWIINYKLPGDGVKEVELAQVMQNQKVNIDEKKRSSAEKGLQQTDIVLGKEDWHKKFADQFTDKVVQTENSYTSPNLSIHITKKQYDTGTLDTSDSGKHKKYGTKISYVLADIYIGDITCLQTAFAENTYGIGYSEQLGDMAARLHSVLALNGDSYSNDRHKNNGTIIRNGVIYRSKQADAETCVLNWDGTMKIYAPGKVDIDKLKKEGAFQSWVFGPSLLTKNGKKKTKFITWDYIRQSHPRTAIGYYEPGHYCMLIVDGRQESTRGMFLEEMSALFEKLGCRAAYNLDGGQSSFMYLKNQMVNDSYRPDELIQDGIFLMEKNTSAAGGKA